MRTIRASNYGNIFKGMFERNFMYPRLQTFPTFYWFIDDKILLWNGSEAQLLDSTARLYSRLPTIKFDFK